MTTTEEWHDVLERAAECGCDCLRDTWARIPAEQQFELAVWHWRCRVAALAADLAVREGSSP